MSKNERQGEVAGAATVGEAVGLVAAADHAMVKNALADAEAKVVASDARLRDLSAIPVEGDESAARQGFAGALARARFLVATEAEFGALKATATELQRTRDLAVHETVDAKGHVVRLTREVRRLTEANSALQADAERLRARGEENWEALKAARAAEKEVAGRIAGLQVDLDAALIEVNEWRGRSRAVTEAFRRFLGAICPACRSRGTPACDKCIARPLRPEVAPAAPAPDASQAPALAPVPAVPDDGAAVADAPPQPAPAAPDGDA